MRRKSDSSSSISRRLRHRSKRRRSPSISPNSCTSASNGIGAGCHLFDSQDDIFRSILGFVVSDSGAVDAETLQSVLSVSRRWYQVASSTEVWKQASGVKDSTVVVGENQPRPSFRLGAVSERGSVSNITSIRNHLVGFANLGLISGKQSTYRAKQRATGHIYQVKIVPVALTGKPGFVLRELALLGRFKKGMSPNLKHLELMLSFQDLGNECLLWYDCTGMTLRKLMAIGRKFTPGAAQEVLKQMLVGLNEMHINGVVHQALSYENVLLEGVTTDKNGMVCVDTEHPFIVKLDDLSLAATNAFPKSRPKSRERTEQRVIIAPKVLFEGGQHYVGVTKDRALVAPELLLGQSYVDSSIDVWSAGCLFASILRGGDPLFFGDSDIERLFCIFGVLGTPTKKHCPRLTDLPQFHTSLFPTWKKNHLAKSVPDLACPSCLDILSRMLELDPSCRITAGEALRHQYFRGLSLAKMSRGLRHPLSSRNLLPKAHPSPRSYNIATKQMARCLLDTDLRSFDVPMTSLVREDWAALVDWTIEVIDVFDLHPRAAFHAMQYFHLCCANARVTRGLYQMLAAACIRMASVCDKVGADISVKDLVFASDNNFSEMDVVYVEHTISVNNEKLLMDAGGPLVCDFISVYLDSNEELRGDSRVRHLAWYIAELALQSGMSRFYRASYLGASVLFVALVCDRKPEVWPRNLERLTGLGIASLEPCVAKLTDSIANVRQAHPNLKVVSARYSKAEKEFVASVPVPVLRNLGEWIGN